MLAEKIAPREHLADQEKILIQNLKRHMLMARCDMPNLAVEIGIGLPQLRMLTRIGTDFDEWGESLPDEQRAEAFQKIAAWVECIESEDETMERVARRMAGFHTISGLAKKLDLDSAALGQLISGATEGWGEHEHAYKRTMLRRLSEWVDSDIESDVDGLAKTPTFLVVQEACEFALATGQILLAPGEPGIGKSMAAKSFCRKYPKTSRGSGAVYVLFESGDTTEKAILERIATALYEQGLISSMLHDYKRNIVQTLSEGDVLVLDEVQFTVAGGGRGGDVFHSLYNATGIPFVMLGNTTMNSSLLSDRKQPFAALVNRASVMPHMQTTAEDVEIWMHWQGYKDKALMKMAQAIGARAGQSGGLRVLANVIRAYEVRFPGEKLTAQTLQETAAFCGKLPTKKDIS